MVRAIGAFFCARWRERRGGASSPHPAAVEVSGGGKPLESIADPDGKRCADELLQLRGFDRLGSAFKKNLAQFAGCFITEPGLLCIEFFALLAQLLERITSDCPFAGRWSPPRATVPAWGHVGKRFLPRC